MVLLLWGLLNNAQAGSHPPGKAAQVEHVFQLVQPDPSHTKLEINLDGIEILNGISQKVAVVAAIGAYHSGKSFLLNQLMDEQQGFALGPTVAPQTKGIWAKILITNDRATIYLDTEGFFGQGASEAYDAKIFAVATLLSSKLLFNSVKTIDQASLDYLELLARRALMFSLKASLKDNHHSYLSFPSLIWVVHDFISEIPAEYGGSPSAWIERLLTIRKRESVTDDASASVTNQELIHIFSSIDCHPLSLPVNSHPENLRHLGSIPKENLDARYTNEVDALRNKISSSLELKKFKDKELNGPGLTELLRTLVELANTGIFPQVPGVWEGFIRIESQTALGDCTEEFRKHLQAQINTTSPIPEARLQTIFEGEQASAVTILSSMLQGLPGVQSKVSAQLKEELLKLKEHFTAENQRNIENYCLDARTSSEAELGRVIADIRFPLPPRTLREQTKTNSDQVRDRYRRQVADYIDQTGCATEEATLKKHINQQQVSLEAKNNLALRKQCSDSKGTSIRHFTSKISSLNFPIAPSTLKKECASALDEALKEFNDKVDRFSETEAYKEIKGELENVLSLERDKFTLKNNNAVESQILVLIDEIKAAHRTKYNGTKLRTSVEMADSMKKLTQEATEIFADRSGYATESNSYSAWKFQFTSDIKKLTEELFEENVQRIRAYFAGEVEQALAYLRKQYRSVAIPLEDDEIESIIETKSKSVRTELEKKLHGYRASAPETHREALFNFTNALENFNTRLRKDNVEELLQLCKGPIERSERYLKEVYDTSSLQFLFEREAYKVLTTELRENIKSEKLLDAAARTYIEDTLRIKYPFSSITLYLKAIGFILAAGCLIVLATQVMGPAAPKVKRN